jgi:hypothetical protein
MAPLVAGFGWLAWIYIINQPVLRLGNDWFEIVRKPFPALRIPLNQINSVRIRQPGTGGGSLYFLEITLNRVTPEIQGLLNSTTKRQTVKVCRQFGDYEPPAEPFVILVVPLLGISDAELADILAREQKTAQTFPRNSSAFGNQASNNATPTCCHE